MTDHKPSIAMDKHSSLIEIKTIARDYVDKQLVTMDGSRNAGIRRIGTERYEQLVADVVKTLDKLRKP